MRTVVVVAAWVVVGGFCAAVVVGVTAVANELDEFVTVELAGFGVSAVALPECDGVPAACDAVFGVGSHLAVSRSDFVLGCNQAMLARNREASGKQTTFVRSPGAVTFPAIESISNFISILP